MGNWREDAALRREKALDEALAEYLGTFQENYGYCWKCAGRASRAQLDANGGRCSDCGPFDCGRSRVRYKSLLDDAGPWEQNAVRELEDAGGDEG